MTPLSPKIRRKPPPPPPPAHMYVFLDAGFPPFVAVIFASDESHAPVKCRQGKCGLVVVPCPSQSLISLVLLTDWAIPWQLSSGPAVGFDGSPCQQTERHQREIAELVYYYCRQRCGFDSRHSPAHRLWTANPTFPSPFEYTK